MLLFSEPRLAVADLQIMVAQVATEAGAVRNNRQSLLSVAGLTFVV